MLGFARRWLRAAYEVLEGAATLLWALRGPLCALWLAGMAVACSCPRLMHWLAELTRITP